MRYFITLSYDGTRYHGWQVQPNDVSVQGELQRALSLLLRQDILVTGAGRTDTGVHARMMVAHFDLSDDQQCGQRLCRNSEDNPCEQLAYKLNRLLPQDIAIQRIEPVSDSMHARFSATSRTYRYFVHTCKSPFLRHYSWHAHYDLDFSLMNEAAATLLNDEDFGAFCKSHTDVKTTRCQVTKAEWRAAGPCQWVFEIRANRFLRNMVRAVVGTLIEVGRGRMTLNDFKKVVAGGRRTAAGESMPAHALFLEKIEY